MQQCIQCNVCFRFKTHELTTDGVPMAMLKLFEQIQPFVKEISRFIFLSCWLLLLFAVWSTKICLRYRCDQDLPADPGISFCATHFLCQIIRISPAFAKNHSVKSLLKHHVALRLYAAPYHQIKVLHNADRMGCGSCWCDYKNIFQQIVSDNISSGEQLPLGPQRLSSNYALLA